MKDFIVVHPQESGYFNHFIDVSKFFLRGFKRDSTPFENMLLFLNNYTQLGLDRLKESAQGQQAPIVLYCPDARYEKHRCLAFVLQYVLSIDGQRSQFVPWRDWPNICKNFREEFVFGTLGGCVSCSILGLSAPVTGSGLAPFSSVLHAAYHLFVRCYYRGNFRRHLVLTAIKESVDCNHLVELFSQTTHKLSPRPDVHEFCLPFLIRIIFQISQKRYWSDDIFKQEIDKYNYFLYTSPCLTFGIGVGTEACCGKNVYGWILTLLRWMSKETASYPLSFYYKMYLHSNEGNIQQPLVDGLVLVHKTLQSCYVWNAAEKEIRSF